MSASLLWRLVRLYEASRTEPTDNRWESAWFKGSPPAVSVDAGLGTPEFVQSKKIERELDPSTLFSGTEESTVFADASWTPRFAARNARLQPAENRIKSIHLVTVEIAKLVQATELRFKVLNLWNDPKKLKLERDGRDTADSVITALLGLFKSASGAPSLTPLYANVDRMAADRFVQTKERAVQLQTMLSKPVIDDPDALAYLRAWAGDKFFDETAPIEPSKKGYDNSMMIRDRAAQASQIYLAVAASLKGPLPRAIWKNELDGFERTTGLQNALISAARESLSGLDSQLLRTITTDAHKELRSLDTLEPIVKDTIDAAVLEAALARVRIKSEQRAARTTLNVLRNLLSSALANWDTRVSIATERAFAAQKALLDEAAQEPVKGAQSKWKERHTLQSVEGWDKAVTSLQCPSIQARAAQYRTLLDDYIAPISAVVDEEPEEASSSTAPPREALIKRGKRLFEALVATRDLLLPAIGSPSERARLIAYVDAIMGAHLAWVAGQPTMLQQWVTSWRGALSVEQVRTLVDADSGGTVQDWFIAPKVVGAGGYRIVTWKAPIEDWRYWVTEQTDASTLDLDMQEGLSPRDPDLEGALDTSFRNDLLRNLLSEWIAERYKDSGAVPRLPIDRVAVMEVARAFQQYLWPVFDGNLRKVWNKVAKMQAKLISAATGTPGEKLKLGKLDRQLSKNLDKLKANLFGKQK